MDVDGRVPNGKQTLAATQPVPEDNKSASDTRATSEKVAAAVAGITGNGTGTNLDEIGRIVGIDVPAGTLANDRIFVQRRLDKSDFVQLVTNRFSSHASVSTLSRNNAGIVLFGSGALKKIDSRDAAVTFVVHSMPGTYVDENGDFDFDGSESRGNYELAAAITRPVAEGATKVVNINQPKHEKPKELRAFVVGDADAFDDMVLMNAPSNRVFLLDAVRWLVGEESFAGEITSEEDVRIEHTKEKDVFWFYSTILGAPALVMGFGLVLARRSRSVGGRA